MMMRLVGGEDDEDDQRLPPDLLVVVLVLHPGLPHSSPVPVLRWPHFIVKAISHLRVSVKPSHLNKTCSIFEDSFRILPCSVIRICTALPFDTAQR